MRSKSWGAATLRDDADVVRVEDALDARLKEWGRWARQRAWLSSCRSIEGRYRPEAGEVWDRDPKPLPVDALEAWRVEVNWRYLPWRERMMLRAYYVTAPRSSVPAWERHKRDTCRKLGLHRNEWAYMVQRGAVMLDSILQSDYCRVSIRVKQFPPHG